MTEASAERASIRQCYTALSFMVTDPDGNAVFIDRRVYRREGAVMRRDRYPAAPMRMIYGTAWKEDDTTRLAGLALDAGFRAFDTANQRKHYFEAGLGAALAERALDRDEVWLQTKFTYASAQDDRLPYDPTRSIATQVQQSFESSLEHLGTTFIDSYLLHGPSVERGLGPDDLEAWEAMEALVAEGRVRTIGVSNVTREQLESLLDRAKVRPSSVQNRCRAHRGWDREVRSVCRSQNIEYQAFSLLTANRKVVDSHALRPLAARRTLTPSQLVFRFALDKGMTPLTGTSNASHMREDLAVLHAPPLGDEELSRIESMS